MWYLNTTQKGAKVFLKEGQKVAGLIRQGKEAAALAAIDSTAAEWEKLLTSTWQGIVEEIGNEVYSNLKAVAGFEIKADEDAFNPWENTIQNYIKSTAASKVVKIHHSSKKAIRNIIDKLRADDATLDQIAEAINNKYKDFSRYRSYRIARTEVVGASNYASIKSAEQSEVVDYKEWVSSGDKRVRESHEKVDGEKIKLTEKFKNGLLFPADYSANKPGETIQCRCTLVYFTKANEEPKPGATTPKPAAPKPKPKPKPKPAAPKPKPKPKQPKITRGHIDIEGADMEDLETHVIDVTMKDMKVNKERAIEVIEAVNDWSSIGYTRIRAYQNGTRPNAPEEIIKHAHDIEEFIKKSPKWGFKNGEIYRGINVNSDIGESILKAAQNGAIIDMQGTSASWSSRRSVAEGFASGRHDISIIFSLNGTRKGASMRHLSDFRNEDEILVSKDSKYTAVKIEKHDSYYIIHLEEI